MVMPDRELSPVPWAGQSREAVPEVPRHDGHPAEGREKGELQQQCQAHAGNKGEGVLAAAEQLDALNLGGWSGAGGGERQELDLVEDE